MDRLNSAFLEAGRLKVNLRGAVALSPCVFFQAGRSLFWISGKLLKTGPRFSFRTLVKGTGSLLTLGTVEPEIRN